MKWYVHPIKDNDSYYLFDIDSDTIHTFCVVRKPAIYTSTWKLNRKFQRDWNCPKLNNFQLIKLLEYINPILQDDDVMSSNPLAMSAIVQATEAIMEEYFGSVHY